MGFELPSFEQVHLGVSTPLPLDRPFKLGDSDVGLDRRQVRRLVDRGFLRPLLHGVYVAAQVEDSIELRADALRRVLTPGGVVTDRTAAWLHGVDVLLPNEHLQVPSLQVFHRQRGNRVRRPELQSGQRMMPDRDVEILHEIPVTTLVRTACDLGRTQNVDRAYGSLDAMLRAGVDQQELMDKTEEFKGYRHVRRLRAFAPRADGRAESMGESIMRRRWEDTTCPRPQLQCRVDRWGGRSYFLDLGIEELFFAVEYDGVEFHTRREHRELDEWRRSWIEENTPWTVKVIGKNNIHGRNQDFQAKLPGWVAEARRTLPDRLRRARWIA